jgi:hypothetical protein
VTDDSKVYSSAQSLDLVSGFTMTGAVLATRRNLPAPWPALVALVIAAVATSLGYATGWPSPAPSLEVKPSVVLSAAELEVTARVTPAADDLVRGWFFLAEPGETSPWSRDMYQSSFVEQQLHAGEESVFSWQEPIGVPPGVYEVSIWFHSFDGLEWVHLDGGTYGLSPITIRD